MKLVDRRPEIDPVTGAVHDDARFSGMSDADLAGLELALRCVDLWGGEVLAVSAGGRDSEAVLRIALGDGARAVRVDLAEDAPSDVVAAALAPVVEGCELVWCGVHSLDRGSGSVPAYLAAHLGAAQALGLIAVDLDPGVPGRLTATRRLDGGRRERLAVQAPAVLSVEGGAAKVRRASVHDWLEARRRPIEVRPGLAFAEPGVRTTRPYRPRARVLPAPAGATARDRIVALTATGTGASAASQAVVLEPPAAAERILDALVEWGHRDTR